MQVEINGDQFGFRFHHTPPKQGVSLQEIAPTDRGSTTCVATKNGRIVNTETLRVYFRDNFSRPVGRKKTLSRVLTSLFPHDRTARTTVWNAYHKLMA